MYSMTRNGPFSSSPTSNERLAAAIAHGGTCVAWFFAPLVVYLISDESAYVSGAEISVDGGLVAHGGAKALSDAVRRAPPCDRTRPSRKPPAGLVAPAIGGLPTAPGPGNTEHKKPSPGSTRAFWKCERQC